MEYGKAWLGKARHGGSTARNMGGHIRKNNKPTHFYDLTRLAII
jgi:hypothetical protein